MIYTAVAIAESIDRRVELIVRADRHHQVLAGCEVVPVDPRYDELRLACAVVELAFIARLIGQVKDVALDPLVEVLEARDDVLDVVADSVVVCCEPSPIDCRGVAERRSREPPDDRGLAEQLLARGLEMAARGIDARPSNPPR